MENHTGIPRVVHYCWFGRGVKPKKIVKCMKSWKKLHGYTFMEWNEDNFDVSSNKYVKQAYEARRYAFVTDYVRLYALYHHGGIYMDTDVEVLKPLDRFLGHQAFSGFEDDKHVPTGMMGAVKGNGWIKELLDYYTDKEFLRPDGSHDTTTNTKIITDSSVSHGFVPNNRYQELSNGVVFYPRTYFCPYDYTNGNSYITEDSYTIHHFAKSWLPARVRLRTDIILFAKKLAGPRVVSRVKRIVYKT